MVKHNAVEGTVDAIIDIVHEGHVAVPCVVHCSLAEHIDSKGMSGACKVATWVRQQVGILQTADRKAY